ncbi:hypothetical protein [Skermania piniformis]|nr:hypothetical protein [Skermania piniformis]
MPGRYEKMRVGEVDILLQVVPVAGEATLEVALTYEAHRSETPA